MRLVLPLLLLAACATTQAGRREEEACRIGVPAACADRGLQALAGQGAPRDEREAAAWLMAACERGLAQSCADLGALYAAGRGVRRDDGRACELGLADACARAGRPPPEVARTPGIVLPPEPPREAPVARSLDDVRRALEFAGFFVPMHERSQLGLTPEALERDPPAPWPEVKRIRPLFDARAPWVATCLPVYLVGKEEEEEEGRATVSLVLGADGRAAGVLVALDLPPGASDAPADCIREAVARWEFPRPAMGGRVWFVLVGNGAVQRIPAPKPPDAPSYMLAGFRAPRQKDPGCLHREIQLPGYLQGLTTPSPIVVKFAVRADGWASRFKVMTKPPLPEIAAYLRRAVYSCEWEPGTDREGKPAAIWVILPVRFAGG